jgi:predicted SnoaL-like aldol condensation-catalyzing enzyme
MNVNTCVRVGALFLVVGACPPASAGNLTREEQANKELVVAFTKAMQEHNVPAAANFLQDDYIQHNPMVPTGKAGFVKFFSALWKDGPLPSKQTLLNPPVLVVTEGDIVLLMFKRATPEPGDPGKTYDSFWFDAYRVAGDKVAEHWDPLTKPPVGAKPAPAE